MKKLLLLSAISAVAMGASAQALKTGSIVSTERYAGIRANEIGTFAADVKAATEVPTAKSTAKTTAGMTRTYDYVSYLDRVTPGGFSGGGHVAAPTMWNNRNVVAKYQSSTDPSGNVTDSIRMKSVADLFDPFFSNYNNNLAYDGTEMAITKTDAYTIDSVTIAAFYGRNPSKTSVVDTLRFSAVYGAFGTGSDLASYYFYNMLASGYSTDTIYFAAINYDSAKNIAKGTTLVVKDLLLGPGDTAISAARDFKINMGLSIPSGGNRVGMSVTYIRGEAVPAGDTIWSTEPYPSTAPITYKYSQFAPLFVEQNIDTFPTIEPGSYNMSYTKFFSFDDPTYIFNTTYYEPFMLGTGGYPYEFLNMTYSISCATCRTIDEVTSIKDPSTVDKYKAYPVPANNQLNIEFTVKEKSAVTVSLMNMIGQTVMTQNMGTVNIGQGAKASFNTGALPAGMYMYTIEANGQRTTSRVSIAH